MAGKTATRNAYGETLAELGRSCPELVALDADLSGATMSKFFAAEHPERFFDCGIAEANMIGIAAGLAAEGYKPFASTFAMFAAGRAYEQIRNSVAYPGLNVKIAGSHGGVSVGEDGATHQCIEDFALMRAIPGMLVCCPCDGHEMRLAVKALLDYEGPAYIRLQRPATGVFTDEIDGYSFVPGKGRLIREGSDAAVIAVGLMVERSLEAAELLAREGISLRVINMPCIKPLDEELVLCAARETGCIVTAEEHSVIGGLGSAVSEFLGGCCPVPVLRHGVEDQFGRSGTAAAVLDYFRLNPQGIAEKVRQALKLKK